MPLTNGKEQTVKARQHRHRASAFVRGVAACMIGVTAYMQGVTACKTQVAGCGISSTVEHMRGVVGCGIPSTVEYVRCHICYGSC